ncbi:TIGR02206 family membrane protein [Ornithinimicrobium cavernae]|uniref:YwaF family protein n=1 Tax=Ornithinimicrobium cavernae TaxID=2666047 RepID=UPI000D692573|nr:TIGR02206 family membrane protein [Ornithinimicrobium cavernae]
MHLTWSGFFDADPGWITVGGPDHLIYVSLLLGTGALLIGCRGWVRRHATVVRRAVAGVVVVQQVTLYGTYLAQGAGVDDALPLHSCRIAILLGLIWLLTRWRPALDVAFYLGLYAYASFSYPQQVQPVDNVLGWSFWVNHAVTLLLPVFAWLTERWRPTVPALWRAFGWFLLYYLVALVTNALTGGNYFYLRDRPVAGSWPDWAYLPGAALATLALFWIGYAVARLVGARTGTWVESWSGGDETGAGAAGLRHGGAGLRRAAPGHPDGGAPRPGDGG